MKVIRKYIRLILGVILMILGIAFMLIPFIPIGYLVIFVALFFLATYFPGLNNLLNKLRERDTKGRIDRIEEKIVQFEEWLSRKLPD